MTFPRCVPLSLALLVLSLTGCGKSEEQQHLASAPEIRFRTFVCIDKDGIGIEAFRVLIPSDWNCTGAIRWNIENPGMPAVGSMSAASPDGSKQVNVFPSQSFYWTDNQITRSLFPVGSRYFGAEVRPVMSARQLVRSVVLPRYRKGKKNLAVVKEESVPELVQALGVGGQSIPGGQVGVDGGKLRIEYREANRVMEEDVYGIVQSYTLPGQSITGPTTTTFWSGDFLFSIAAEKGSLDSSSRIFRTILGSFRVNPVWHNKYVQVVNALIQGNIRHIKRIGEISRMISQMSDQISDERMRSYNDRQQVYDRLADDFCRHIRDVDAYYDPYQEREIELPAGYTQAWTNNLGEYVVSELEDFNPNVGSNLHWEKMERK